MGEVLRNDQESLVQVPSPLAEAPGAVFDHSPGEVSEEAMEKNGRRWPNPGGMLGLLLVGSTKLAFNHKAFSLEFPGDFLHIRRVSWELPAIFPVNFLKRSSQ